jgi:hypothetical protein
MRGPETIATPIYLFIFGCSWNVTLALLGDRNFGIRIGSKGWVGWARVCAFPSFPCGSGVWLVCGGGRLCQSSPLLGHSLGCCSVWCPCLGWHPAADSELVWTKRHDKLGAGITQESSKKLRHEFPMGGQGPRKRKREWRTETT